jgi:hypothetical protein
VTGAAATLAVGCLYRNHVAALQNATEKLLGDRLSHVHDGGECDVGSNRVLHAHRQTGRDADVTLTTTPGQPAILGDLEIDAFRRVIGDELSH